MNPGPCPFCGSVSEVLEINSVFVVQCKGCRAIGPDKKTKEQAISQWAIEALRIRIDDDARELAAYRALSGGKTAMEYALFVDGINKIEEKILFFLDQMENIAKNTGKTEYYINYIKEIRGEFEEKTK